MAVYAEVRGSTIKLRDKLNKRPEGAGLRADLPYWCEQENSTGWGRNICSLSK